MLCLMGCLEAVAEARDVDGLVRGLARHVGLFCRMRKHFTPGERGRSRGGRAGAGAGARAQGRGGVQPRDGREGTQASRGPQLLSPATDVTLQACALR